MSYSATITDPHEADAMPAHGTRPLDPRPARALADYVATCERATPEQLGAMSV